MSGAGGGGAKARKNIVKQRFLIPYAIVVAKRGVIVGDTVFRSAIDSYEVAAEAPRESVRCLALGRGGTVLLDVVFPITTLYFEVDAVFRF